MRTVTRKSTHCKQDSISNLSFLQDFKQVMNAALYATRKRATRMQISAPRLAREPGEVQAVAVAASSRPDAGRRSIIQHSIHVSISIPRSPLQSASLHSYLPLCPRCQCLLLASPRPLWGLSAAVCAACVACVVCAASCAGAPKPLLRGRDSSSPGRAAGEGTAAPPLPEPAAPAVSSSSGRRRKCSSRD